MVDGQVGGRVGVALVPRAPVAALATPGPEDSSAQELPGARAVQGVVPAAVGLAGVVGAATTRAAGDDTADRAQLHPRIVGGWGGAVYSPAVLRLRDHGVPNPQHGGPTLPATPDDAEEQREALGRAGPSGAERINAQSPTDEAHRDDRHDHVVEGTEHRDELRDQVDRREDPGEQAHEHEPNIKGHRPIDEDGPQQPEHIRHDLHDLAGGNASGPEEPEDDEEGHPQPSEPREETKQRADIHARSMPRRKASIRGSESPWIAQA